MASTDPGLDPEPPEPERFESQSDKERLKLRGNLNRFSPSLASIKLALFLALTFFALPSAVLALNPSLKTTQYMHTSWRIQDGSLPAGMFSITQTTDGFLWFLTLSGDVYRFDGVSFAPLQVPTGPAGKIFADNSGGLWVTGNELFHLQSGTVTAHFDLKGLHGFQSMAQDADGSLWIGLRSSNTPLCHVIDGSVNCFGKDDGISITDVNAILSDGSGGFWLGGSGTLLHWRHGGDSKTYPVKSLVTSLARAADGSLWVGMLADRGLAQLKQEAVTEFDTPAFKGSKISVTSLMTDRDGNLWVTTDAKGVFVIRGTTVEHYGHIEGLSGDSAWALFEDREGIVWGGTTSGVDSFRDPRVVTFSATEGLGKDQAAGILATKDGTVWVANSESLDRIKDGVVSSIRKRDGLPGSQVASLLEDHAGKLWVGVDDGLYLFEGGRFRRLPEPDHQPLGMVVGITEDIDGNIWAECASKPRKLVRIRDFQIQDVYDESRVPRGHNLAADPHGGIWIETRDGDVVLFRNGTVETKIPIKSVGSPLNRQIAPQPDGSILVGSENGLVAWRNNKAQALTTKNGLPCDFVIAFIKDKQQQWWLYTRCGLVEFSDAELQKWWANPETKIESRLYDAFDGAQPNIGSFNAAASTADGRVWFSSGVVVQMIEPAKLSPAARPAKAYIESLTVDRKEIATTGNVRLAPHPRDLSINYTSPTFLISQRVRFRYRLDGYEQEWHDAGTRRQAFYTDLPPGNYSFSVIACSSDGAWSDSPTTFNFSITPAIYQTTWFRLSLLLVFVALLWLAYQLRVRQLATQFNRTFEARVGERTRIARELHDTLLQSFQGLLLRFQSASNLLPERPVEAKHRLNNALDQAAAAIAEGRDAVQGLRASAFETNDLANSITGIAEELTSSASATDSAAVIEVEVEGTTRELKPIVRDEAYRVAAEALRNAFRHAGAGRIKVEIRYDKQQFRLRVRDDGKGIDEDIMRRQPTGHFGLPGMRERAESVGGRLEIWTKLDSGTQ